MDGNAGRPFPTHPLTGAVAAVHVELRVKVSVGQVGGQAQGAGLRQLEGEPDVGVRRGGRMRGPARRAQESTAVSNDNWRWGLSL